MRILENRRGSTVLQAVFEKIKNLFTLIYVANISIIKHVTNCHRSVTLIPGTVLKSENEIIPRSLDFPVQWIYFRSIISTSGPLYLFPIRLISDDEFRDIHQMSCHQQFSVFQNGSKLVWVVLNIFAKKRVLHSQRKFLFNDWIFHST